MLAFIAIFLFTLGGGAVPSFASCDVKEGYIGPNAKREVQTERQKVKFKRLTNHALAAVTAFQSTLKLLPPRCLPPWTPSYLIYNGGNVLYGIGDIGLLIKYRKESKKVLEVNLNEEITPQITAFDEAYENQMDAYRAARRRAKLFDSAMWIRRVGVVAAGFEMLLGQKLFWGGLLFAL